MNTSEIPKYQISIAGGRKVGKRTFFKLLLDLINPGGNYIDFCTYTLSIAEKKINLYFNNYQTVYLLPDKFKIILERMKGHIFIFDVTSKSSLLYINQYVRLIKDIRPYPIVFVGNKTDLVSREIEYDEAKSLADSYGAEYFEISLKDPEQNMIERILLSLGNKLVKMNQSKYIFPIDRSLNSLAQSEQAAK